MRKTLINTGSILGTIFLCGSGFMALADEYVPAEPVNSELAISEHLVSKNGADEPMTPEQIEAWFNDDAEERALAVNEGKLEFLSKVPNKPAHHSHNTIIINNNSLSSGWVGLIQCHSQLDAVPATQIVYRYRRMNNLRIESFTGIGRAWVEDNSVQLEDIQSGARLCIRAEVGILYSLPDGRFILKNGPFHRKFLDGYYPMQVTLLVQFPDESIKFESITPQSQPGFTVRQEKGRLHVNAWFEGELMTDVRFTQIKSQAQ